MANIWSTWSRNVFWILILIFKLHSPFTKFIKSNLQIHSLREEWHFKWEIVYQKIFQEKSYGSPRENCPNTEFFLVRIFLHLDWILRKTESLSVFSPNAGKNGSENNFVFGNFSRSGYLHNGVYRIYSSKAIHNVSCQLTSCQKICKNYILTSYPELHMQILRTLSVGVKNVSNERLIWAWNLVKSFQASLKT